MPDSKKGEAIALLVKGGTEPENIEQILKESSLAPIMMPSYIFIVDDIPTLASGKVDFKGGKSFSGLTFRGVRRFFYKFVLLNLKREFS